MCLTRPEANVAAIQEGGTLNLFRPITPGIPASRWTMETETDVELNYIRAINTMKQCRESIIVLREKTTDSIAKCLDRIKFFPNIVQLINTELGGEVDVQVIRGLENPNHLSHEETDLLRLYKDLRIQRRQFENIIFGNTNQIIGLYNALPGPTVLTPKCPQVELDALAKYENGVFH